ncbi:hypothetical protein [Halalkalicoccus sp. NIPERK01]|uniref:hypothetical protein n=1 Tax=Halalkalicoccus sp. NIPERK01 TaxID=3053469 RepID=UPI00256F64A6|nr:hypothetical protein [Halalkalicoccus sp. NIPERK01]MDL5363415.1 hypothetical protein [Halalkalicoccus sp. NIPERK01]
MNTSHPIAENSIGSPTLEQHVTGPHWELPSISNATTYWRCTSCNRESIREEDLYRPTFHTADCEVHEC